MDHFLNLPEDKQNKIVDAALAAFARGGYKKTSVSDVAAAAGISKPMVFHYFGKKKMLYFYLLDFCNGQIVQAIERTYDKAVTDFFERITMASRIKYDVVCHHPGMLGFLESVCYEQDPAVYVDIQAFLNSDAMKQLQDQVIFERVDVSKFKDGVDPRQVMDMIVILSYGFISRMRGQLAANIDQIYSELEVYMQLLKNNLYKPEYL
ncbi:MAG: TetR/AcrR family transcriptional regulator [Sporolactobacillus sp.]